MSDIKDYLKEHKKHYIGPKFYKDGVLKRIRELEPSDEISDIILEGTVVAMSDIEHVCTGALIYCKNCKEDYEVSMDEDKNFRNFRIPNLCKECKKPDITVKEGKDRIRKIMLQETDITEPHSITAYLFGENVLFTKPGEKVAVGGKLRSVKKHEKDKTYRREFDIFKIRSYNSKLELPDKTDMIKLGNASKEDFINSFAPHIQGMELYKEALLISLIGGVERENVRGDINTFLVGDPGTAKTQLLKFAVKVSHISDYASGRSASAAGLLAGVDNLSDNTRVARAGPVVLCSGGMVAIDEMDKMSAYDRSALHEAMETREYSLTKIGINQTWEAKTVIIGAANPHGGNKWDDSLSIKENVKLPDSLLSRFGLIFLVRDSPDKNMDLARARHIRLARQGKIEAKLSIEELKKFINHCRTFSPELTDEAGEYIENWWAELRSESQDDDAPLVDNRVLEDLYRLADAYARFNLSEKVLKIHAVSAIELLQKSLLTLGMNTPGERAESNVKEMNKEEYLMYVFEKPISESQAIAELLKKRKYWKTESKARQAIANYRIQHLTELEDGRLKWI